MLLPFLIALIYWGGGGIRVKTEFAEYAGDNAILI